MGRVTILERLLQSSRKGPLEVTEWIVCVCACSHFHLTVCNVGGMVAQWLVVLPPRRLHVSPKFQTQTRQVDWRLKDD